MGSHTETLASGGMSAKNDPPESNQTRT